MMEGPETAICAARAAARRKAVDIEVIDLKGIFPVADYFVICSGHSTTQIAAISQEVQEEMGKLGMGHRRQQGTPESGWVLLDYGDVIVHIFSEQARSFYNLEHLWGEGKRLAEQFDR